MISSIVVQFNNSKIVSNLPETWARLQQEDLPMSSEITNLTDLYQMIAYVKSGKPAESYIYKTCNYAEVIDGVIILKLNFYVWLSDLDLIYNLTSNFGTISEKEFVEEHISKSIIFNGSNKESIGYIFDGEISEEMPFFDSYGKRISPNVIVHDSYIELSKSSYCVFRVKGIASGYKHTITMEFPKLQEGEIFSIDNIQNSIILRYLDENGEIQTDTLDLKIPKCVEDLLLTCSSGNLSGITGCAGSNCRDNGKYKVYISECDGNVILERWENR